jgi:hypothetical protein
MARYRFVFGLSTPFDFRKFKDDPTAVGDSLLVALTPAFWLGLMQRP